MNCSKDWHNIHIYKDRSILYKIIRPKQDDDKPIAGMMLENRRKRSRKQSILFIIFALLLTHYPYTVDLGEHSANANAKCNQIKLPMTVAKMDGFSYYNLSVKIHCPLKFDTFIQMCIWRSNETFF